MDARSVTGSVGSAGVLLCVLFCLACEGAIGESGNVPFVPPPIRRPDPESLDQTRVPLRALSPFELSGAINSLGMDGSRLLRMQPRLTPDGVDTLTEPWAGDQVELLEQEMRFVAESFASACAEGDLPCIDAELAALRAKAYRRPLTSDGETDEAAESAAVYHDLVGGHGHTEALVRAVQSTLLSAEFLYLIAIGNDDGQLTDHELAGRLSFFVWAAAPDETLLDAAARGDLSDVVMLEAQVRRMLEDPRAARGITRFVVGWLGGLELPNRTKADARWREGLPADALTETHEFVSDWFRSDERRFSRLFDADHTFLTPRLAQLYGVDAPNPDGVGRFEGTRAIHRSGLLTQATFLAHYAGPVTSSPTLRGKWFLERALCRHLTPPDGVDATPPEVTDGTTRDAHEALANQDGCRSCHQLMFPFGAAFESFDGIVQHRDVDNGFPVNTQTTLANGGDLDGSYAGPVEMSRAFGGSATARGCFASKWVSYALGRGTNLGDAHLIEAVTEALNSDAREALVRIATSDAFRRAITIEVEAGE